MINVIIFSKDNPMKLDATIRSIKMFWSNHPRLNILFKASNADYMNGYLKVLTEHRQNMVNTASDFNKELKDVVGLCDEPYTMFLTHDCLFTRPLTIDILKGFENKEVFNIITDDIAEKSERWVDNKTYYPFVIKGGIYRTHDVEIILESIACGNPNELEDNSEDFIREYYGNIKPLLHVDSPPSFIENVTLLDNEGSTKQYLKGLRINLNPFLYSDNALTNIPYTIKFLE